MSLSVSTERPSRLRRSLRASIAEGVAAEVVGACAGVSVLTGWAIHLGCGPLLIGVLGGLQFLGHLVELPAAWLVAPLGQRRLAIGAIGASRIGLMPLGLLAFAPLSPEAKRLALIAIATLSSVLAVVGGNAWIAWMGDLVPASIRGRYFARRAAVCTVGAALAALATGLLLDAASRIGATLTALAGLAVLAGVAGAASMWLLGRQHEPGHAGSATAPVVAERRRLGAAEVLQPLRDPAARRALVYLVLGSAGAGVVASFQVVHLLVNVRVGFAGLAAYGAVAALARVLSASVWGRAIDRVGARPVLIACSLGLGLDALLWLAPSEARIWPLAIEAPLAGALLGGHVLAAFALPLAIAPRRGRSFYVAVLNTGSGVSFALAAAGGGALAAALPARAEWLGAHVFGLHALFVTSCALRGLAAVLAARILEPRARGLYDLCRVLLGDPRRPASPATATALERDAG